MKCPSNICLNLTIFEVYITNDNGYDGYLINVFKMISG